MIKKAADDYSSVVFCMIGKKLERKLRKKEAKVGLIAMIFIVLLWGSASVGKEFSSTFLSDVEKKHGDYAKRRLVAWQKLMQEHKNDEESMKLETVNQFFNLFEFRTDEDLWHKEDYWATPLEFIIAGAGDCEDFTLAKYFTLLEIGVPDEKLLITYVKALELNQAHMVLTYYATPDSTPLVLDNLNKEILSADQRKDLLPVYSFNGKGLWQAKELGKGNKIGESSDLKRWTELGERMKSEQIGTFY